MKTSVLAAAIAAGTLCTASTADAQYYYRGSYSYAYPSYSYSTYSYPSFSYAVPSYYGNVVTAGYTPSITPVVYPSGYYYNPAAWAPTYSTYGIYSGGYRGVNVYPAGVYWGRRSGWRW